MNTPKQKRYSLCEKDPPGAICRTVKDGKIRFNHRDWKPENDCSPLEAHKLMFRVHIDRKASPGWLELLKMSACWFNSGGNIEGKRKTVMKRIRLMNLNMKLVWSHWRPIL